MLSTLRHHPRYARLFAAQLSGLLGAGVLTVALALLAAELAGPRAASVLATALTVKILAYVTLSSWIARATARWAPVRVLLGADAVRVVVAATLPFVDATWQVYVLVAVLQASSAAFTPAYQALLPRVLPDEADYRQALALSRVAYDAEAVVSPALASLALLVLEPRALFAVTALGFLGSGLCVLWSRPPGAQAAPDAKGRGGGLVAFVRVRALRRLLLLDLAAATAYAAALVLTATLAGSLGGSASSVGLVLAVFGAGSVVGALLVARHAADPWRPMGAGAAVLAVGLLLGAAVGVGSWAGLAVVWAVLGLGSSLVLTPSGQVLRTEARGGRLSLVFAGHFAWSHACYLLTYPLAGLVAVHASPRAALVALGVVAAAALAGATALGRPVAWRLRHNGPVTHPEQSLRHDVDPTPERLAEASAVFGLLSDRTRLHLLWLLARGDADVTTLADEVEASRTSVSQHLAKLRLAGLVVATRDGRHVRYSLVGGHLRRLLLESLGHADHVVTGEPHHA